MTGMDTPTNDTAESSKSIVLSVAVQGRNYLTGCDKIETVTGLHKIISRTRRDTATPISRPVFMLSRIFNLNPVIDVRTR